MDLSRQKYLKNYKSSFNATADNTISWITDLKTEFEEKITSLNEVRKERNAIIDRASKIFTKNKIKLSKPLGKYDNDELCEILTEKIDCLTGDDREVIQICKIQIDNRYKIIEDISKELNQLMIKLSNVSRLENDSHEEVVVNFNDYKKKKGLVKEEITESSVPIISNEDPVIPALEVFNESLEDKGKFEAVLPDVEPEDIVSEVPIAPVLDTIEEEPELVEEELPIESDTSEVEEIVENIEEPLVEETEVESVEEIVPEEDIPEFIPGKEEIAEELSEEVQYDVVDNAIADEIEDEKIYQTMSIEPIDDSLIKDRAEVMADIIEEKVDEEFEQVVGIKQASPQLLASVNEMLDRRQIKDYTNPDSSFIGIEDDIIGEDDLFTYDNDISSGLSRDIVGAIDEDDEVDFVRKSDYDDVIDYNKIVTDYYSNNSDEAISFENQDDDSMPFTLDDKLTLDEIANNVYGDSDLWKDLYKYGSNKSKIDKRAREAHVSVSVAATNPGYLAGLELNFPVELVTYEEVPEDNYSSRYSYETVPRGRGRRAA